MNTKNPLDIGEAIRLRRKELGVTQKDLALTCGTGLRFIVDLEKGKATCQIGKMLQVIRSLGLEVSIGTPAVKTSDERGRP